MEHPTRTLLEYAFAAARANEGYVKNTSINENVYSNRDLITYTLKRDQHPYLPQDFPFLEVCDLDREKLAEADEYMRRYTLLSLGNLSQFQKDVYAAYLTKKTDEKRLGLIAYFPHFVEREIKEKVYKQILKTEYKNSSYILEKNIKTKVKLLKQIPLLDYGKYLYIAAVGKDLVSFAIPQKLETDSEVHIRAKVKSHDSELSSDLPLTQLNYVKILED